MSTSKPEWFAEYMDRFGDDEDGPVVHLTDDEEEALMKFLRRSRARHIDILPRLKTRESTKWIFGLRVSSGCKYAFA